MKWIFYLLLLANVVFFAYMQLVAGGNDEAQLTRQQFHAEKIKLLNPKDAFTAPVLKSAVKLENAPAVDKSPACLEWGAFSGVELARAQNALDKLQLGDRLSQRTSEETVGYWVYIPPLNTKKDAESKIGELKALGIGEYFLMQDNSPWRNAISLGVFKSEELARNYLAKLQAKGVKSAVIGERNHQIKRTLFQIRDAGGALANKLAELQRDFPGSELKTEDCPKLESTSASR
ncbi:MAG: SPOR domain-containing protein [Burkholderiales bacterium]